MDTNSYLILGLTALTILLGVLGRGNEHSSQLARLERKVDGLLKQFEIDINQGINPELLALVKSGKKLEAIAMYKHLSGQSLRDAKAYVERL